MHTNLLRTREEKLRNQEMYKIYKIINVSKRGKKEKNDYIGKSEIQSWVLLEIYSVEEYLHAKIVNIINDPLKHVYFLVQVFYILYFFI